MPPKLVAPTSIAMTNPPEADLIGKHIMFYDGVCVYCKGVVESSLGSDATGRFYFSPLQSEFAQRVLGRYGIDSLELLSMYVVSDYGTSDEAVRAAAPASNFLLRHLSGELKEIGDANARKPREVQDAEYKDVADHRYERWGKMESIPEPTGEVRSRYVF
jgi:predicted DCC family thiol-disulfide oxidoreductase YuxK